MLLSMQVVIRDGEELVAVEGDSESTPSSSRGGLFIPPQSGIGRSAVGRVLPNSGEAFVLHRTGL